MGRKGGETSARDQRGRTGVQSEIIVDAEDGRGKGLVKGEEKGGRSQERKVKGARGECTG